MEVDIDARELSKAIRKIEKYSKEKAKNLKDIHNKIALDIQRDAKRNITDNSNVDTGRLRASIQIEMFIDGLGAGIGTRVHYAPYLEFGTGIYAVEGDGRKTGWFYTDRLGKTWFTRGIVPSPFLFPAWEKNRPPYLKAIQQEMRDIP